MNSCRFLRLLPLVCCLSVNDSVAQNTTQKTATERLDTLENRTSLLEVLVDGFDSRVARETAVLNCSTHGFGFVVAHESPLSFLVACTSLEPYLEGYRLTVDIGNPYSMQFEGINATVGYGENMFNTKPRPVSTTEPLKPGAWTHMTVVINRVTAKDVRAITLTGLTLTTALGARR